MKIGITHKLFLSFMAAACVAVVSIFFIMQWSINRGFLQYVKSVEQERMEQLAERLAQDYAEQGNWDFLRSRPRRRMMQLLDQRPEGEAFDGMRQFGRRGPAGSAPMMGAHGPRLPFVVLDAERKPLFGNPAEVAENDYQPIIHNGNTVGYIGLLAPRHFLNPRQSGFLKQQKSMLLLATLGMALLVAILSVPLARRLVRPVRAMALATRELASGKYSVRVPVSSSDELGQLARDFNAMASTLEKNETSRRQWVADISHELRTPISILRGEVEALLEGVRSTTPESIRSLHVEALRLQHLVDDLYQLSLSDLGALIYHKEEVDLAEVLDDTLEKHRPEFARKGIRLKEDIPSDMKYPAFADTERLHQLFGNLLDNSLKYTDSGGELLVAIACRGKLAIIEFQDSAPGVAKDELERLFDRLYRVDASRNRSSGGAGLGLAICKNIVEAHEGSISAHPSPLGGVMIQVTIPLSGECP